MENAVKHSLAVGEDVPRKSAQLAEHHTVHISGAAGCPSQLRRAPTPPFGVNMKESTRPTLATAIAELVRLRQLAETAGKDLPPYGEDNVGDNTNSPPG